MRTIHRKETPGRTLYSCDRAIWWSTRSEAIQKAFKTIAESECPACKEIELRPINIYDSTNKDGDVEWWTEYTCDGCGHYEQRGQKNGRYDTI